MLSKRAAMFKTNSRLAYVSIKQYTISAIAIAAAALYASITALLHCYAAVSTAVVAP
jgi:hypothetical protein